MTSQIPTPSTPLRFKGIAAAPGLAQGPVMIYRKKTIQIQHQNGCHPSIEEPRLQNAIQASRLELTTLRNQLISDHHTSEAFIFEAHLLMMDDASLMEKVNDGLQKGLNAESAWIDGIEFFASQLDSIPDATLQARAADLRDIGQRVLAHLCGAQPLPALKIEQPSIIVASDLAPSETVCLDKRLVLAFCTAEGGPTSHTAILAKALGIPAVVALGSCILDLREGDTLLVNGSTGDTIAFPTPEDLHFFDLQLQKAHQAAVLEMSCALDPAITSDGLHVEVVANIGNPEEASTARQYGAEGIGLLRTEFLFLERKTAPTEEEQYLAYRQVMESMPSCPVVARTIDVGGDKEIPYLDLGQETNPFLGWRAIRMCLDQPEFFKIQLRALLRASPGCDLRIMFPMVATLAEVRRAKSLLDEAKTDLLKDGIQVTETLQVGIMVETPSAAIMADQFAKEVDFFSIGTNDLTQYTLAAERTNPKLCHLHDACHPSVLRLIQTVITAAHSTGIWVGVCGELAADPDAIPILLGLGLDEFSMAPRLIPHAKLIIRQWSNAAAMQLALLAVNCDSAEAVRQLVHSFHQQDKQA